MNDLPSTFLILSASFSSTNCCFSSGITLNIVSFCLRHHLCVVVFVHRKENWQCFSRLLSRHFPPCFDLMLWCIQSGVQLLKCIISGGSRGWAPAGARWAEKHFFQDPAPPYLRDWVTGPPLIWRSGSTTDHDCYTVIHLHLILVKANMLPRMNQWQIPV